MAKRFLIIFLCAILVFSLSLVSCSMDEDSKIGKELCEKFLDHILDNNKDAALAMIEYSDAASFESVWAKMRESLKNSKEYEIKQVGWRSRTEKGITLSAITFEISTDDEKLICMEMIIFPKDDALQGLRFLDSTEFVNSHKYTSVVNIFLIVFSVISFAFVIWMLVDCIKRKIPKKALWILVIIIFTGIGVTIGTSVAVKLQISLILGWSSMVAYPTSQTVKTLVLLPIGAIIYFFMRKRLVEKNNAVENPEQVTEEITVSEQNEQE